MFFEIRNWEFFVISGAVALLLYLAGVRHGRRRAEDKSENRANWTGAMAAVAAAVIGVGTVYYAGQNEDRMELQDRLFERRYAENVYLQVAPEEFYGEHPELRKRDVWLVVNNNRGVQLREVWVQNESGSDVRLETIPPCTMRPLPPDFESPENDFTVLAETAVHFRDPSGSWRRYVDGLLEPGGNAIPDSAESLPGDLYYLPREVRDCGASLSNP